ncbi:MAG: hypothetical protein HY517_01960 [Candidatus Aenigmarchaeota archaeon]|nr:hypothetical protein [Candidatus Aenigmarchaeota archaeon]
MQYLKAVAALTAATFISACASLPFRRSQTKEVYISKCSYNYSPTDGRRPCGTSILEGVSEDGTKYAFRFGPDDYDCVKAEEILRTIASPEVRYEGKSLVLSGNHFAKDEENGINWVWKKNLFKISGPDVRVGEKRDFPECPAEIRDGIPYVVLFSPAKPKK